MKTREKGHAPPLKISLKFDHAFVSRWIIHKMVILILLVMFCAPITSSYDSTHDVLCKHCIVV